MDGVTRYDEHQEFLGMVAEMRRLQKLYFKTKEKTALIESKQMEARVDKWIKQVTENDRP